MKKRFLLRLDPDTYDMLERWAADDLRSINGQIEYLLVDALKRSGRLTNQSHADRSQRPPAESDDQTDE